MDEAIRDVNELARCNIMDRTVLEMDRGHTLDANEVFRIRMPVGWPDERCWRADKHFKTALIGVGPKHNCFATRKKSAALLVGFATAGHPFEFGIVNLNAELISLAPVGR